MSKLTMIFFGSLIVGMGSLFASRVCAEINSFGIYSYICVPNFVPFTPRCACETTGVVYVFSRVLLILCMCAIAQVVGLIVQCIPIFMVYFHSIRRVRNDPVHQYLFSLPKQPGRISHGIKRFCVRIVLSHPLELIEFLIPIIGHLRDLTLRERDQFHFNLQKEAARSDRGSYQNERAFKMLSWLFPADNRIIP